MRTSPVAVQPTPPSRSRIVSKTCGLAIVLALLAAACDTDVEPSAQAVGRMDDRSFDRARGSTSGVNARGEAVGVDDFEGGFVWVEHSAPWCGPCRVQAPILHSVAQSYPDVTFVVLLTATQDPFQAPTRSDASAWAAQHGLDPKLVVAKSRNDTRVIPQHRLYSPEGQLLYSAKGQLPEALIREVLEERVPDWMRWKQSGDEARWMR